MATTTTFLTLCNDAILESGSDLASFATDGSDFDTPATNQLKRFKKWVQTAWLDVQQEVPDWHFMMHEAEVTSNPGIMFYTENVDDIIDYGIPGALITILDQDGTIVKADIPLLGSVNLSTELDEDKGFGYVDVDTSSTSLIDYGLKVGNEYFMFPDKISYMVTNVTYAGAPAVDVLDVVDILLTRSGGGVDTIEEAGVISFKAGSTVVVDTYASLGSYTSIQFRNPTTSATATSGLTSVITSSVLIPGFKCFVHSWKSIDFSEETGDEDFVKGAKIKQINQSSFSLIDPYSTPPGTRYNLQTLSWEQFRNSYDRPSDLPAQPVYITEDVNGRWRLYPNPRQKYTLRFTYQANPQDLVEFDDIPKGIPEEFVDIIMWGALVYYGEYSETPSIAIRAKRQYDRMMSQLQFQKRPKFALKPARLY